MSAEQVLGSLLERVKTQLAHEYHDDERQAEELRNMTVERFLEMLSYIMEPPAAGASS